MTPKPGVSLTIGLFTFLLVLFVGTPMAHADSISFDSTNCNSSAGCYGLDWSLTVNSGSFMSMGEQYDYEAILNVTDDPLVAGTPTVLISAVDFKASSSVIDDTLLSFPTSSSGWITSANGLSSSGCNTPGDGFVCSQTSTDPANFTASSSAQSWVWLFNTSDAVVAPVHIGAKLTDLSNPGKLLSVSATVPEPGTLTLLLMGLGGVLVAGASRRRYC